MSYDSSPGVKWVLILTFGLSGMFLGCHPAVRLVLKDAPTDALTFVGAERELRAIAYDREGLIVEPNDPVRWTSSQPAVAEIDAAGKVTAVASGQSLITAQLGDVSVELPLTVRIVGRVDVEPLHPPPLKIGATLALRAKVFDERGQPLADSKVSWRTSSPALSVDRSGVVTALASGSGEVFADCQSQLGSVRVEVK